VVAVLVVDDDPTHRALVGEVLATELGARIVEARDGYEALLRLQEARPDLVVLDLRMPRVDGLGVLRWLASNRRCAAVPVIVMTALEPCASLAGREPAVVHTLRKPFDLDELASAARTALAARPTRAEPATPTGG